MSEYIIRVELHDGDDKAYETLHKAMGEMGMKKTISDGSNNYHLQTAEYHLATTFTIDDIIGGAKTAASKTGKKYSVFVCECVKMRWYGLDII